MRKYIPLIFVLIIFMAIWIGFNFIDFEEKKDTLSNVTEFYSQFDSPVQEYVSKDLQKIGCEPVEFYMLDSEFCFICDKNDVCFGYEVIKEEYGQKMILTGNSRMKNQEFNVDFVNFHEYGFASYFNCKKETDNSLSCDYDLSFVFNDFVEEENCEGPEKIELVLNDENNWLAVSDIICKKLQGIEFSCEHQDLDEKITYEDFEITLRKMGNDGYCLCGNDLTIKFRNGVIVY